MSKGTSATQRTLKVLKDQGYTTAIVEKWNRWANCRQDLYNCIDILAIKAGEPVFGVQSTVGDSHNDHVIKAKAEPKLRTWLATGSRYELWSWRKLKKKWVPRVATAYLTPTGRIGMKEQEDMGSKIPNTRKVILPPTSPGQIVAPAAPPPKDKKELPTKNCDDFQKSEVDD